MAMKIYCRVSTGKQTFDRQMMGIKRYFETRGMDITKVESTVVEHVSGGKSYEDRKFKSLLLSCKPGDIIYASSTDRLGRNFFDMIKLMSEAKERGIKIVACKQDISLDDDNPMTKMLLSIQTIIDEDERARVSDRNIDKAAWQKEQVKKQGYWIIERGPNKGKECYHHGREKGCDLSIQLAASIKAKQDNAVAWREHSIGYDFVRTLLRNGVPRQSIIEQFNEKHEKNPGTKDKLYTDGYSTPKGSPLSEFTLSKWANEMAATLAV